MKSEAELGETAHCCTVCKVTHLPLALENSLALKGHLENNSAKMISIITLKLQFLEKFLLPDIQFKDKASS